MDDLPDGARRRAAFARRIAWVGLASGLLLAMATSGGIAGERVTRGAAHSALLANALATCAALLALVPTMRRVAVSFVEVDERARPTRVVRLRAVGVLLPQIIGAIAGIALVHALIGCEVIRAFPWLSERPAQWMNDVVAVAGLLTFVWAAAGGLDWKLLVGALVGITIYRATAPMWHLDHAPGGFHTRVQDLVVAQLVGAALALGAFRVALGARDP